MLHSFIGVFIEADALRCRRESTPVFFSAAISRNSFEEISTFLRFDEKLTRVQRKEYDKLAAIKELWDAFVRNCPAASEPHDHITIDKQLVCFRGKLGNSGNIQN